MRKKYSLRAHDMAPPTSTVQDYIASLAGRYEELQDSHVVSGESSRRFNNYIYSRKLLIRKAVDDSGIPLFFYYE